ncbi:hypothetical protein SLEP1_g14093 [Rubroshorea leprosula]|uniref:Uncharacterized protein n=1 Tax=Rubroshorea leprosula TaxID=152421 RepID=A0AAV5ISE1_9ROSI|nr:hypothetical protein SLEP1_g14093 [Rubroshorea leprosula]
MSHEGLKKATTDGGGEQMQICSAAAALFSEGEVVVVRWRTVRNMSREGLERVTDGGG